MYFLLIDILHHFYLWDKVQFTTLILYIHLCYFDFRENAITKIINQ
jgi:hypothetical protein